MDLTGPALLPAPVIHEATMPAPMPATRRHQGPDTIQHQQPVVPTGDVVPITGPLPLYDSDADDEPDHKISENDPKILAMLERREQSSKAIEASAALALKAMQKAPESGLQ